MFHVETVSTVGLCHWYNCWHKIYVAYGRMCVSGTCLTRLFDYKQDGLAAGVLIVLKTFHTVILIFIGAVHCILVMELWRTENQGQVGKR